ncbi:MAG: hypothetical protein ACOCYV_00775 [Planctomycetota bacterium]
MEGVLGEMAVAQQASADAVDHAAVPLDDQPEGLLVTVVDETGQQAGIIGLGHRPLPAAQGSRGRI